MRRSLLIITITFLVTSLKAQENGRISDNTAVKDMPDSTNVLRNYKFDTVTPKDQVAEMSATHDSLVVTFTKGDKIEGYDRYRIISREHKAPYHIIYVKMDPSSLTKLTPADPQAARVSLYGVFVFHFEKENGKVLVLHDGRLWPTKNDAKEAYSKIWLPDEYYNTWYNSIRFANFINYPNFRDVNKITVERVIVYWFRKIIEHSKHKLNTINGDAAGSDYGRDNFTKVLVNYRISPWLQRQILFTKSNNTIWCLIKKTWRKAANPSLLKAVLKLTALYADHTYIPTTTTWKVPGTCCGQG